MTAQSTSAPTVTYDIDGTVARVTLARPEKRNAVDEHMLDALLEIFDRLHAHRNVGVVVLAAQGSVFSGGVDLNSDLAMDKPDASAFDGVVGTQRMHRLITAVAELPQVTIAAIQGDAVGGAGFGIAMACDLRYVVDGARFWMVPTALHEIQDFGLTWFLQRYAGDAKTLEWVLTGDAIGSDQALQHGLVQAVCSDQEALESLVRARCASFTSTSADVIKLQKYSLLHGRNTSLQSHLDTEALASALCFQTEEFAGAIAAVRERLRRR